MKDEQTAPEPPEAGGPVAPAAAGESAASATPAVAAAAAENLFTRLTAEGRELVPVNYRFLAASPTAEATLMRLVESRPYRAKGYVCAPFHKPISKCCGPDEPAGE